MDDNPLYFRAPRVPLWRRGCAFGFDSAIAWILATLIAGPTVGPRLLVFALSWFSMRVIVPSSYFGQSPGRWAFDMRVVSDRDNRTPLWQDLAKREAISGLAVFLALLGFFNLGTRNAFYLILLLPLGVDVGVAWFDPVDPSAFHDRVSETRVVATRRGYSLDLKVKKWVALISRNVKQ